MSAVVGPAPLRSTGRAAPILGLFGLGVFITVPPDLPLATFLTGAALGVMLGLVWRKELALLLPVPAICSGCLVSVAVRILAMRIAGDPAPSAADGWFVVAFLLYGVGVGLLASLAAGVTHVIAGVLVASGRTNASRLKPGTAAQVNGRRDGRP
jgi:hypothetical protein